MITIFWDLDGVLADYDSYWDDTKKFNRERFKKEVLENNMFEELKILVNGCGLYLDVREYLTVNKIPYNCQILSSLGSPNDETLAQEVARQKTAWINSKFGTAFTNLNFTKHKGIKKQFATPTSILIDDTEQNIFDFNENYGHGILYNSDMDNQTTLKRVIDAIDIVKDKIERKIY